MNINCKILTSSFFLIILPVFSLVFAQGTVTVTGTDLSPVFSPGTSTPIVTFSSVVVGSPIINQIQVNRTGTATNSDVPSAKLYRDVNKNNIVDGGDVLLDQTRFFNTATPPTLYFQALNYSPSASENLLIVYDVATGASTSNTAGASIPAGYITGGNLTTVVYTGTTTGNQPLPVELISFDALVQDYTVTLEWKTATEVNNFGFEIERSQTSNVKSEMWEKIGFVQGHGNSNSPKEYSFEDKNPQTGKLQYRLKQIDFDGGFKFSDVVEVNVNSPSAVNLQQNYPNPFNPSTTIRYEIPKNAMVALNIFDLLGREIKTLVNLVQESGYHEIAFNGNGLSSGIYIYRIQADGISLMRKMILMK